MIITINNKPYYHHLNPDNGDMQVYDASNVLVLLYCNNGLITDRRRHVLGTLTTKDQMWAIKPTHADYIYLGISAHDPEGLTKARYEYSNRYLK